MAEEYNSAPRASATRSRGALSNNAPLLNYIFNAKKFDFKPPFNVSKISNYFTFLSTYGIIFHIITKICPKKKKVKLWQERRIMQTI